MTAATSATSNGLREEKKDGNKDGDQMKAEELRALIREVLEEQRQKTNEGYDEFMMHGGIEDDDHEVEMAMSDLHKIEKYAPQVSQLASQYSDLPGWVQSKITLAADYLGKVYHYLDGKHNKGME